MVQARSWQCGACWLGHDSVVLARTWQCEARLLWALDYPVRVCLLVLTTPCVCASLC